jgi:hypothetical protein
MSIVFYGLKYIAMLNYKINVVVVAAAVVIFKVICLAIKQIKQYFKQSLFIILVGLTCI